MNMSIKFETLKTNAAYEAHGHTHHTTAYPHMHIHNMQNGRKPLHETTEELHKATIDIISRWDIRNVQELTHLFPSLIPKKYANTAPIIDMNDKGDWVLFYQ